MNNDISISCLCGEPDNSRMVQCDICDEWAHFACAGVDSGVANVSWSCDRCTAEKLSTPPINAPESNPNQIKPVTSESQVGSTIVSTVVSTMPTMSAAAHAHSAREINPVASGSRGGLAPIQSSETHRRAGDIGMTTAFWPNKVVSLPTEATQASSAAEGRSTQSHERPCSSDYAKNVSNLQEIQLRMLDEQHELQRLYIEQKFKILSGQGPSTNLMTSTPNNTTEVHGPTQGQLAARQVLPKDLPTFNGDPEEWPIFISSYENSTAAAGYSQVENLMRLQASLKGKAREVVRSKLLVPAMVPDIINTLKMYFGRPEHIIQNLIERVKRTPQLKDKLEAMIEFSLSVSNICATMEACKMYAHLSNPVLVAELLDKLPSHYKLQWAMHPKDDRIPDLKNFSSWLHKIAEAASQVVSPFSTKRNAVLNTHTEARATSSTTTCIICKVGHKLSKCNIFAGLSVEQRWTTVRENKLCPRCLNSHRRTCYVTKRCEIAGCKYKHHPMLHKTSHGTQVSANANPLTDRTELAVNVNTHSDVDEEEKPYFRIVPICIHAKHKSLNTFAFLDEGSSVTLMDRETFESLGIEGVNEPLCLKWTGETTRTESSSQRASIEISNPTTMARFTLPEVHTTENLALPRQSVDMNKVSKQFPYLAGLPIKSYRNAKPTILIGVDNWRVAVPLKIKEGGVNQPIATKTRLGWALQGNAPCGNKCFGLNVHLCQCERRYRELHEEVKTYFALEPSPPSTRNSEEDGRALRILDATSKLINGRFETGLLWQNEDIVLPESYSMALKRFRCLEKKFDRDPALREKMSKEVAKLVSNNYARKLTADEITQNIERVWYLPIFVTVNHNKAGKIRLVWDGAAKSNGASLNDFILRGPDLLTPLVNILLAFRIGSIAICGDIESMFHRITVRKEDMHAQRFLWRNDEDTLEKPSIYAMSALTFGISCAPCIAHYIRNKNADRFQQQYPRAVEAIKSYHYVDDFIDSVDNEYDALQLASQVKQIHASAGFNLQKWNSNSTMVLEKLMKDGFGSQAAVQLGSHDKVLGMYWDPSNDTFKYVLKFTKLRRDVVRSQVVPTKRETLQALLSIFDPLGFLSCFTIKLKILLQSVWRSGIEWDDELPDHLYELWNQWRRDIPAIEAVEISRCYAKHLNQSENVQLHTFVDAGEYAYAAVCYLRVEYLNTIEITLVAAKSKVAPIKPVSIPRLELQAAVMGTRLAKTIMKIRRIPIQSAFWWTDSKTVLKWLTMDPRNFQSYVMFRVGEILDSSNPKQWRWVPSKQNSADIATKVTSSLKSDLWFSGPDFLYESENAWPAHPELGTINDTELKHKHFHILKTRNQTLEINYAFFSSWKRLHRAIATFLLYIEKLRAKTNSCQIPAKLTFNHLQRARKILLQEAQSSEYSYEISCLKRGKSIPKNSKLISLNIRLDEDDLIKVRGRAEFLNNHNDAIVLPTKHPATFLIVREFHERNHHISHETTINNVRAEFYIPKLRVLYKKVRASCQKCKLFQATPSPPQMASLPAARLAVFERPFTFVGIDYFGPFLVIVGRRREKRWGVIFTCLTTRAIHIEVAHSLDTSSSIMCIRNFISRRGTPREIYTDNGTNFKATEKIVCNDIYCEEVTTTYDNIKWRFNPPSAPHMGGAWERLIRSIKTTLYKLCSINNFTDETFRSALLEVEFIINSRPLTFVSLDSNDDEAITPNHILLGSSSGYKPIAHEDVSLRQRWKQCQVFADRFWQRWINEYSPTLTRRSKWFLPQPPLKQGDVVMVVDENLPRNCWPKGIIVQTVTAKDGQVRRATIKTQHGLMIRPATKIALLDVGK